MHLVVNWGTIGCSIRLPNSARAPVSLAWLNPPGKTGWYGLTDFTLGFDFYPENTRGLLGHEDWYIQQIFQLPGAQEILKGATFKAVHLTPEIFTSSIPAIIEIWSNLSSMVNASTAASS